MTERDLSEIRVLRAEAAAVRELIRVEREPRCMAALCEHLDMVEASIADFARCDIAEVKEAVKLATCEYRKQGMAAARKCWTVSDGEISAGDYSKYVAVADFLTRKRLARTHE